VRLLFIVDYEEKSYPVYNGDEKFKESRWKSLIIPVIISGGHNLKVFFSRR
jgi:hypothetical protein